MSKIISKQCCDTCRITEGELECTFSNHLAQPSCSSRAMESQLLGTMSRWLLSISKDEYSMTALEKLLLCFITHREKEFPDVQMEPSVHLKIHRFDKSKLFFK